MVRPSIDRASIAAVILCLGLSFHGCAGKEKGPVLFHPLPPEVKGYELTQGALRYNGPGFTVTARPLDWRMVEERYRRDNLANPFGEGEDATSHFVFFSLRIENGSDQDLLFNAYRVSAFTQSEDLLTPVDLTDLYSFADVTAELEEKGRVFQQTCFDSTVRVGRGEEVERYLVFPEPRGKVKKLKLILDDIYVGGRAHELVFLFEAFPGTKEK